MNALVLANTATHALMNFMCCNKCVLLKYFFDNLFFTVNSRSDRSSNTIPSLDGQRLGGRRFVLFRHEPLCKGDVDDADKLAYLVHLNNCNNNNNMMAPIGVPAAKRTMNEVCSKNSFRKCTSEPSTRPDSLKHKNRSKDIIVYMYTILFSMLSEIKGLPWYHCHSVFCLMYKAQERKYYFSSF